MINLGVKYLLPKNYKAFAWIDADIEFENTTWALDTLKILNGCKDVVQLFSHAVDMSRNKKTMSVFNSAGYQRTKGLHVCYSPPNLWHPGFAWAITRKAYESLGGLYENAILFSFPSLYEGFGLPVLESFASKCPVLLSNKGSLPEIANDAAQYFDPYDKQSLFVATNSLLNDEKLRNILVTRGSLRVQNFTWENTFNKTLDVYKKVVEEKKSNE
jgi:glycosyltransferase involved in cell wall biosynthesis